MVSGFIQVKSYYCCDNDLIVKPGEHEEPDLILSIVSNSEPKEFPPEAQRFTKDGGLTKGLFFLDSYGRKILLYFQKKKNLFWDKGYLD